MCLKVENFFTVEDWVRTSTPWLGKNSLSEPKASLRHFKSLVLTNMFPELHVSISYAIGYWANYSNGRSSIKLSGKYLKTTLNCSHSYQKGLKNITGLFHFISCSSEEQTYESDFFLFFLFCFVFFLELECFFCCNRFVSI